jgi:HEAT repeat protein
MNSARPLLVGLVCAVGTFGAFASYGVPRMPPTPCPKGLKDKSSEYLAHRIRSLDVNGYDWSLHQCFSKALASKGAEAIPAAISLLNVHNGEVEETALQAICLIGPAATDAVPALIDTIRARNRPFSEEYSTLACIGEGARAAIPFLIAKSRSTRIGLDGSRESRYALQALGRLGQYEPDTIVPHLIRLLEEPNHIDDAARALATIGPLANSAVQALRRHLATATAAGTVEAAFPLIAAIGRVPDAAAAVPLLTPLLEVPGLGTASAEALKGMGRDAKPAVPFILRRLEETRETDWPSGRERVVDVEAIAAIDSGSRKVQRRLLIEATANPGTMASTTAILELVKIDPLPADFAPILVAAIEKVNEPPELVGLESGMYRLALKHTHVKLAPRRSTVELRPPLIPVELARRFKAMSDQDLLLDNAFFTDDHLLRYFDASFSRHQGPNNLPGKPTWERVNISRYFPPAQSSGWAREPLDGFEISVTRHTESGRLVGFDADLRLYGPRSGATPFEDTVGALGSGWVEDIEAEFQVFEAIAGEPFNPPIPAPTHPMGRKIIAYKTETPALTRQVSFQFTGVGLLWLATMHIIVRQSGVLTGIDQK